MLKINWTEQLKVIIIVTIIIDQKATAYDEKYIL